MMTTTSSAFLKEFTLYCDKVSDEKETLIVTRANDKDIIVLSLAEYNDMKKQFFLAKK